MSYRHILFDLDGTIAESAPGIIKSYEHTFDYFGINYENVDMMSFVGPPLRDNMLKFLKDGDSVEDYIKKYREYYGESGILQNQMYSGIEALLAKLKNSGRICHIASSKPVPYIEKILKHFGIFDYFTVIGGDDMEGNRGSKADVINYVMELGGLSNKEEIILVGDRKFDAEGAKLCGIKCIGVLFGYGSKEELLEAGADYIAEDAEQVWKIIDGQ